MNKTTTIRVTQNVPFRSLNVNLRILNYKDIPEGVTETIVVNWGDGSRNTYKITKQTAMRPFQHMYRANSSAMMNPKAFAVKNYNIRVEHPQYLDLNR